MNDHLTPLPATEPGRILLVDDDVSNLDVLNATLAGPNYRVFVARSGEDALDADALGVQGLHLRPGLRVGGGECH